MAGGDWSGGRTGDYRTSWHALRGVDVAGLATILRDGIHPSRNSSTRSATGWETAVCLSGSPEISLRNNREANSFVSYTMDPSSLSLALATAGVLAPNGGFTDEHRVPGTVPPDLITAVSGNDTLLATPLTQVQATFETMKPPQAAAYIDRNMRTVAANTASRPGRPAFAASPQLQEFAARSAAGDRLSRDETQHMHRELMGAYSSLLATADNPAPTVRDAVNAVLASAPVKPEVIAWSADDRRQLMSRNAQVARASGTHAALLFAARPEFGVAMRQAPTRSMRAAPTWTAHQPGPDSRRERGFGQEIS